MKNREKPSEKTPSPASRLTVIYSYYCKLNPQKLKHKNFDDVTDKADTMDLHEFMTFCKDFHLIAKQHRLSKITHNLQEEPPNIEKPAEKESLQNDEHDDYENKIEELEKKITQQLHSIEDSIEQNEFLTKNHKDGHKVKTQRHGKSDEKMKIKPTKYLTQKRLSQIFKKEVLPEGTISFEGFKNVAIKISEEMYRRPQKESLSEGGKDKKPRIAKIASKISSQQPQKQEKRDYLQELLGYLNIDTKENIFQTFKKINELHGNLDHLALMRSPIKKVNPKHDPLGKYAGIGNESHSRLVQNLSKPEMVKYRASELPSLKVSNSKSYLKSSKKQQKSLDKQNYQSFLTKNKSQIEYLNKNFESRGKVSFQPFQLSPLEDSTVKYQDFLNQKKQKKYSQRHKDRIMGNAATKELGRLIEASELYSDDIFNKYLEINHSPNRTENKLVNSRFFEEK